MTRADRGGEYLTPPGLAFAAGHFANRSSPVTDETGRLVATIVPAAFTSRFDATDAWGAPLCSGRKVLFGGWEARDPSGAELVGLRAGLFTGRRAVFRDGGLVATIRGQLFRRSWVLETANGRVLLTSESDNRGWNVLRDAWIVRTDGTLTLAEIVAVVELHRLDVKRRRDSG